MSATWIKINTRLPRDPRVLTIAAAIASQAARYIIDPTHAKDLFGVTESVTCNALCDVTCMALQRIWVAGNEHTTDGIFRNCSSIAYLDLLAGIHGFGKAMEDVGWASYDAAAKTITLTNFMEHNSPDKNGQRSRSAGALRIQKFREKQKAAAVPQAAIETLQTPLHETKSNVTTSNSISNSKSTGSTLLNPDSEQTPPVHITLDAHRARIDALRPAWKKMPAWSYEDNASLLEALPNLDALEPKDWLILTNYMKWANSTANQGRDAHKVTSRRHLFLTELPSYLDRATAHWKQSGSPRLDDATKPATAAKPKAPPAPEHVPTGPTDVFKQLAHDLKIPARAESPLPASPAPSRTLPPPDFDSPAYQALVASHTAA
jgi:hypothetical protein